MMDDHESIVSNPSPAQSLDDSSFSGWCGKSVKKQKEVSYGMRTVHKVAKYNLPQMNINIKICY